MEAAVQLFAEVQQSLDVNKSLPWQLSIDALKAAWQLLEFPETRQFLDDYLLKIIQLMTLQSPSKLGTFEKNVLEDSILTTMSILSKVLPANPAHVATLVRLFDGSIPFYHGSKVGYTFTPGYPAVRIQAAKRFADLDGFSVLLVAFQHKAFTWPGGEALLIILKTLNVGEVLAMLEDQVKADLITVIMGLVLNLPDEQLRRENTEVLSNLLHAVSGICKHLAAIGLHEYVEKFRVFWFENTFKFMNSGSLVMKLFAWEQLNDLILEAKLTRPLASTYIVEGSGTAFVNGTYTVVKPDANIGAGDALVYTKAATAPHMPLLTLFRCTMRTKAKWWFISQADLEKPGTDKDIDFYLHKSSQEDEREPPIRGWTRVNPGINLVGVDPPPVFRRGELLLAKGTTRESYFDYKLLELCGKSNLLGNIFGPSIHREIVARSGKLLVFLAEYDYLKKEDLQLIWKAAMSNNEVDIVDEIFALLVPIAPYLSNELFAGLIELALEALKQGEHYAKIAQFVEKFSMENYRHVGTLLSHFASVQLLSLVWEVYRDAQFETLKNTHTLHELLSFCLNQRGGVDMVIQRIRDCRDALHGYAEADAAAGHSGRTDEAAVSRVTRSLAFLVSKHVSVHMVEQLAQEGLVTCVVAEIQRFVSAGRKRLEVGSVDLDTYAAHLADRLNILKTFYSIQEALTMPFSYLQTLSSLLSQSAREVEVFFAFLRSCSKAVVSVEVALQTFQQLICSPEVDWARCGDEAFECFSTYYCDLEGSYRLFPVGTELPPKLGLDTLWRIALNINSPAAMSNAVNLLLQAYDSVLFHEPDAYSDLLRIVFSYLEGAIGAASDSPSKALSPESQQLVSRCVHIVSAALAKSKGEADPAHAVRGTMFRIGIAVFYRRVTSYFNQVTQMDVVRSEKGSEGIVRIEVHPLHTVKELKEKIIESGELGSVTINLDNVNRDIITNTSRLSELGLVDGSELSVTYQSSFATKSYEEDLYAENTSSVNNSSGVTHVGQILANNYSMFDSLLTLCELSKDVALTSSIWQLIMLIPTQVDLIQQSVEQVCFPDSAPAGVTTDWNQILQNSSETRTAYLLQIIDNLLQPAPELGNVAALERSFEFRDAFIATGGFSTVLRILISTPSDESIINSSTLAVALHIVHLLLFGDEAQQSMNTTINDIDLSVLDRSVDASTGPAFTGGLLEQVEAYSAQVIEKLLFVARNAAAQQSSQVVQNALMVITKLIKSSDAASQLTSNPQSEVLLTTVLRSASKKVREMASEFAVQVGRTQPVVFKWLLSQLKDMTPSDQNCAELFSALTLLMTVLQNAAMLRGEESTEGAAQLARILSDKLINYPRKKMPVQEERNVLLGYLQTLDVLIGLDAKAVANSPLGENLVDSFFSEFLFAMPSEDRDETPICDTPLTRQAAFRALSSYLATTMEGFEYVLGELSTLSRLAARHMHGNWGLQVSHDVKKPDMEFSGLKNQGCTCYMNSLLQVLYMSTEFREAVLATPLLETHRTSLWHKSDIELVGDHYLFEYSNGSWREGQIVGFDAVTSRHRVQYTKSDGSNDEIVSFNIHEGRNQRETGRVRVIPDEDDEPVSEREDAAYRVLDQLQRVFCFMKFSKRRFFDPMPFVEACKSLNLNFNVYHQNDAAEFCDQLLDRIETATKGKHTKKDIWKDVFMKNVFGGKWLYQKIPQDCETYAADKTGCGHWQSSRLESFLKVELMIRGKDKVEDSLAELMQGELMDGDNKIHCDVCTQKKATVRRTCFGDLPSTLLLHLKRFDLDFQTFETVKLNNRMAFPARINMLKYTKEGIEAEERRKEAAAAAASNDEADNEGAGPSNKSKASVGSSVQYETAEGETLDPADYEYELQGILVHAGVAQGGHYYSFIRDDATEDEWYRFDDDEVTAFQSEQIPVQCFGGPPSANGHNGMGNNSNLMDEDRTSNALMVLYNKVKKNPVSSESASAASSPSKSSKKDRGKEEDSEDNLVLVDGYQAYQREVRESNLQHILTCYLLDPDLHAFVRGLLSSITSTVAPASSPDSSDSVAESIAKLNLSVMQWSPKECPDDLPLRTVQYNCNFLMDVVLHCRERAAMRSSVHVLKQAFEAYPHTAVWFVSHILDNTSCSWFSDFTLHCTDALARATFVQIVVHAVTAIAPKDPTALAKFKTLKVTDIRVVAATNDPAALTALMVRLLLDHTFKTVIHVRTADELFVLIRDLSAVPCICKSLLDMGMVAFLSYFIMPDQVAPMIRSMFEKHIPQARQNVRVEYNNLLQSVYEAMAALLGVPQIRKVALLQERTYWESDLVPDARDALTAIFNESSHHGGMDNGDIGRYFERVTGQKVVPAQVRNLLDRFPTNADGRLNLEGFLQYHTDQASYSPKTVWRDLHAFGYRNDLTRATPSVPADAPSAPPAVSRSNSDAEVVVPIALAVVDGVVRPPEPLPITENCRSCLSMIALYEVGMNASESATRAIAKRVCLGDASMSSVLVHQALSKLLAVACDNSWNNHPLSVINDFLRLLLGIEDGLQRERLHEIMLHPKCGLAVVAYHEKTRPSNCRANEFNKYFLFERYVSFVQELLTVPGVLASLTSIAEEESKVLFVRGFLRLKPGYQLTDNEDSAVRNTVVLVENAGVPEVNGEYHFTDVRFNAGFYTRRGLYNNKEVQFTLYKCSLKNGGFQWFLSITPDGMEPGTSNDLDFYYALAKPQDKLPAIYWLRMNPDPQRISRDPAPSVTCLRPDLHDELPVHGQGHGHSSSHHGLPPPPRMDDVLPGDSSDSDKDSSYMIVGDDNVDDSFVSSSTDPRDYYD